MKPFYLILLILFSFCGEMYAQLFRFNSNKRTDTSVWLIRQKSPGIVPGNATYFAAAVNFSRNREWEFSVGRSNIIRSDHGRGMIQSNTTNWGFSCGISQWSGQNQYTGKFFLEHINIPPLLFGNFVVRTDYAVNFTNKQQYFRPSLGITLLYADLLYSYSFKTVGNGINQYRHGFTLRAKFIAGRKKAEWDYYIKNRPSYRKQLAQEFKQK